MSLMEGAATVAALRKVEAEIKVLVACGYDLQLQKETSRTIKTDG